MIIKKIFEGNFDNDVHLDFLKYSKGIFNKKYLLEVKNSKKGLQIKTGPEFANYFVKKGLELANSSKVDLKGIIVSTLDINIPFSKEKKQFMGIKQYKVNGNFNSNEVLEFIKQNPKIFFALSFSLPNYELKIKPKMPKSPKPSNKVEDEDEISPNFCSLKTNLREVIEEMLFEVKEEFQHVSVEHIIQVDEIIYPEGYQKMKPEEIREKSKRKGKIIRKLIIDGKEKVSEASFVV
ncbi:MAG: hypothetical protein QXX68_00445 [Candidatus Pacearchaeota archaeon]